MRFLIWGAGAIGGTLGAYLARAGHDVTFVDTVAEHVDAMNSSGLHITGPIDDFTVRPPAHTTQSIAGSWETIVLATKAHHTEEAARSLAPHLAPNGFVISAQNGLNELAIAQVVGEARTVGAFVNFGADYLEPGVIHFGGRGAVVVGETNGQLTPRVLAVRDAWRDFDARAIATPNIWGYLWGKEAYGAMLFATALTNDSIADSLARPEYRRMYKAPRSARPMPRSTPWSRIIADRRRRTVASGATSPCENGRRKWMRNLALLSRSGHSPAFQRRSRHD